MKEDDKLGVNLKDENIKEDIDYESNKKIIENLINIDKLNKTNNNEILINLE